MIEAMKPVRFLGDSLKVIREFPKDARQDAGYQGAGSGREGSGRLQADAINRQGSGRDSHLAGTFRVIYTARLKDAVYVLHAFQKKTQATSQRDIETARRRLTELIGGRS
jgi:phage-related protein